MDIVPDPISLQRLQGVAYDDKWQVLRDAIRALFHSHTVKDIARVMKQNYNFDAKEPAYRYRFSKWGWSKNIPGQTQDEIIVQARERKILGKRTRAERDGVTVPGAKLQRRLQDQTRRARTSVANDRYPDGKLITTHHLLPKGRPIFVNFNRPFLFPLRASDSRHHESPAAFVSTPLQGVTFQTPSEHGPSPGNPLTPVAVAPSPMSAAIIRASKIEHTRLFLQGQFLEMAANMEDEEKRIASKWLYQFWFFAYSAAKYWATGNRHWTAVDLAFEDYSDISLHPSPSSPSLIDRDYKDPDISTSTVLLPSQLCKWSVHTQEVEYAEDQDGEAPTSLPTVNSQPDFDHYLRVGLETNAFSTIPVDEVPLGVSEIVQAAILSPNEMIIESFCFAVMARNFDLVVDLVGRARKEGVDLAPSYPLHIATSYLDGGTQCCNILDFLLQSSDRVRALYRNEQGHTVLDNLILTILQSHAQDLPGIFDQSLKREARFSGFEVDICGRWDADSPCLRALLASGKSTIPFEWKHKFCHTSVQAVFHCIAAMNAIGLPLASESGLFVKTCFHCGKKLSLQPLHALTLAAFYLGQAGASDEDLFGMVAILLCLISCGLDSDSMAELSLNALLGSSVEHCSHREMTPFELSEAVTQAVPRTSNLQSAIGWQIFGRILQLAEESTLLENDFSDDELEASYEDSRRAAAGIPPYRRECKKACCEGKKHAAPGNALSRSDRLGHIWAAVQTELLTYRRRAAGDPWHSQFFNLNGLHDMLQPNNVISMPLTDGDMMLPYCACGRFRCLWDIPLREEAAQYYFGNLDVWARTSFISVPPRNQ